MTVFKTFLQAKNYSEILQLLYVLVFIIWQRKKHPVSYSELQQRTDIKKMKCTDTKEFKADEFLDLGFDFSLKFKL